MHRFFADERGLVADGAWLSEEDSGHALRVLRLTPGDEIELVCAPGRYVARIAEVQAGCVRVQVLQTLPSTEARAQVTLYQGLPKADKMEWIVQKSTELGVFAVQPVAMARSIVKLEGKDAAKKTERWQKIAREAVKQCARICVPQVQMPRRLAELEAELCGLDLLIVPWEDARDGSVRACLEAVREKDAPRIGILIGPEGGIAPEEAQWLAQRAGDKLVTLGPRILRTETAGLCALTMVLAGLGEME